MFSFYNKTGNVLLAILLFVCSGTVVAQNINTPNKSGPLGTEVNTLTGNLFISRSDIYIPARGFDINISFSYNSFNFDMNKSFGNGWGFTYDIRYGNDTANNKIIQWGDGRDDQYTLIDGGGYKSPSGFFNKFTQYQPGKFLITEPEGTKYYFDNNFHRKITRLEERNGNFINFVYTDTLLTSVVNNAGQSITFGYNASGLLTSVTDAVIAPSRTWNYSYDGNGNLLKVTDPLGGTSKYTYLVNGPMKTMSDKNDNTIDIIYYPDFTTSEIIGCNKRISFTYDTTTKFTVVTDFVPPSNNQVTTYGYKVVNGQSWLSSLKSNCCGYNMTFDFDANGNKIKETDANGNITTYTYDSRGNMLTKKDALNQTVSYTYTSDYSNILSFTDAKGFVTSMTYNSKGDMVKLTAPGNLIYKATYNTNGDILNSTDATGGTYSYNYDTYGNPVSVTGPNGYKATLGFNARGQVVSYTDARGNTANLQYDILNRLKKITDPINNIVQYSYDAVGNVTLVKNQNNENSQMKYDASGRLIQYTDPLNNSNYLNYDAMDNPIAVKSTIGNTTTFSYDARNRMNNVIDPLGNSTTVSYDANGNVLSAKLPNGEQLNYHYDPLNRIIAVKNNGGTIASLVYDKNNNVVSLTNGTGATTNATYDNLNRIRQLTDPLGNSYILDYNQNSNIVAVTDRNGFVKNYTYDSLKRVKTYTDNNGFVITVNYDINGNIVALTDQNNNKTNYTYDSLNRLSTTAYPDNKYLQYIYDNKSNIITKKLTDGTNIQYVYDSLNRIKNKILSGGQLFNYTYDALSRVTAATNNAGTVNITYDALNRILSETYDGRTVYYNYDVAGRTQSTIYPDSTTIIKTFDTRNRLISISKNNTILVSYQYDNSNQLTTKTFANGISTNLQYDFANRLSNFSTANGSIQNTSFTYDKERNKKNINRFNNSTLSEQFTYDNGNRIINYKRGVIGGTPILQNSYTFDALGNRISANLNGTTTTYSANNLNQLTSGNNGTQNINYTYDNNGNLTFDGIYYKTYDGEVRLLKDSASPLNVITYKYDAFGRRVQKIFNGVPLKYTYSGLAQVEERDGITNSLRSTTVFKNFLTPITNEKNGATYYYHQNELNSVEAISNSSGNLTESYRYDVFGKQTIYDGSNNIITSSIASNRFGFTGQEYDSATGSNRFYFRNYNPATGTFNQRDLIGYADGMGMYQYLQNNPANGVDVFGLERNPCIHDPKKIKYVTKNEIERNKRRVIEHNRETFPGNDLKTNFEAVGSADSRFYDELSKHQEGNDKYYFMGNTLANYEVNYYFTGYTSGSRNWGSVFSQASSRAWNGGKGLYGLVTGKTIEGKPAGRMESLGRALTTLNPFDTRSSLMHLGNADANMEFGNYNKSLLRTAVNSPQIALDGLQYINRDIFYSDNSNLGDGFDNKVTEFGEWWPVINPKTGEIGYEFFANRIISKDRMEDFDNFLKKNCPQNQNPNGTQKPTPYHYDPITGKIEIIQSNDPNEILGPDGVPGKKWVSINDRMPYTILCENSKSASAPAKYVRITTPIEPKQDPATFQLGSFGFNNLTFSVPNNTASYYQRLDLRDSLGLYVDVVAGYDQLNKQAFWQFESIDPVTLVSTRDPLKGLLLLQDSANPLYGHGFVNFSMKPLKTSVTLDTIGAKASIVFDGNDTIPTNIHTNTIDAVAPASRMNNPIAINARSVTLNWTGTDDVSGSGIDYYTVYTSGDQVNYSVLIPKINQTDTTVLLNADSSYCFFVLATDKTGNRETLRTNEIICRTGGIPLPVNWLYFNGKTVEKDNVLDWATASEKNTRQFDVQRSANGTSFSPIGIAKAAGNSSQHSRYQYKDYNIDKLKSETNYYRLKQINIDGTFTYSNIVRLTYKRNGKVRSIIYPNPTEGSVMLVIKENALFGSEAGIYDINGRLLEKIKITSGNQVINLGKYLAATYFIKLKNGEVFKVIKN